MHWGIHIIFPPNCFLFLFFHLISHLLDKLLKQPLLVPRHMRNGTNMSTIEIAASGPSFEKRHKTKYPLLLLTRQTINETAASSPSFEKRHTFNYWYIQKFKAICTVWQDFLYTNTVLKYHNLYNNQHNVLLYTKYLYNLKLPPNTLKTNTASTLMIMLQFNHSSSL